MYVCASACVNQHSNTLHACVWMWMCGRVWKYKANVQAFISTVSSLFFGPSSAMGIIIKVCVNQHLCVCVRVFAREGVREQD